MNLKQLLIENTQELQTDFESGVDINQLLHKRSDLIDQVLIKLWQESGLQENESVTLLAVGGYGRREMHPASDIDLLLLLSNQPNQEEQEKLSSFIGDLWDLGLEVGHGVRTLDECIEEANKELTIITNLMESRYLSGNTLLFDQLRDSIQPGKIWSSDIFFSAKIEEQRNRYKHYGDSSYRVEPNLKEGPGGLRDIQIINWIVQREFGSNKLSTLKDMDMISEGEFKKLIEGHDFLWRVRFVLHQLANRKEDRLLFNHQRKLAHQFGYTDDTDNKCIETFMQKYYFTITVLERITEVTLGILRERILHESNLPAFKINDRFLNHNSYLSLANKELFSHEPNAILEAFHILQITPNLNGMSPNTIRAIRDNLHLIDDKFREDNHNKSLFIKIIGSSSGVTLALRLMNRYGVLANYLPIFANIVGRMQYDLFHAYTVDEHTLKVIRNVRRLSTPAGAEELPFCSRIFRTLHKPLILYVAALFHDIAKGRGGSHSEKGAVDALEFCLSHGMNIYDANTVSWLVREHLTMSTIAQRKDTSDPEVIIEFADKVSLTSRLDYLYLLTISDIRGTNPTLLNSWKHSLLQELYKNTRRHLQNQGSISTTIDEIITEKKDSIRQQISFYNISEQEVTDFWAHQSQDYILHTPVDMMLWHITQLSGNENNTVVAMEQDSNNGSSTLLLIYAKNHDNLFVRITSVLEQLRLNIVAARIHSTADDSYALDTLHLLNADDQPISYASDLQIIQTSIKKALQEEELNISLEHYHTPRQLKYFDTPTKISFAQNTTHQYTVITITTGDSPGLLTRIASVFYEQGINVLSARIATLGEVAEDIFNITINNQQPLTGTEQQEKISKALQEALD